MTNLDKRISRKKITLNNFVRAKSLMDKEVLSLSEELDSLIVKRMRRKIA
jgi:hypothetical protein